MWREILPVNPNAPWPAPRNQHTAVVLLGAGRPGMHMEELTATADFFDDEARAESERCMRMFDHEHLQAISASLLGFG